MIACSNNNDGNKNGTKLTGDRFCLLQDVKKENYQTVFVGWGKNDSWSMKVIRKRAIIFKDTAGLYIELPFSYPVLVGWETIKYSGECRGLPLEIIISSEPCNEKGEDAWKHCTVKAKAGDNIYTGCGVVVKNGWCGTPDPPTALIYARVLDSLIIF
ncbi:MAG: hypothetical protein JNM88_00150 [Chitinophagaceae bacterium]|nr:hypothetical protein [Chitinophagaceae bacterium]